MEQVFIKVLNMGASASWLILAVIILRPLMKRMPRWTYCLLWMLVAFRLISPVTIESAFSMVPESGTSVISAEYTKPQHLVENIMAEDNAWDRNGFTAPDVPAASESMEAAYSGIRIATAVWLVGIAGLLLYAAASNLLLRKRVAAAVLADGNVLQCDDIDSPFILGLVRPRIYLPSFLDEAETEYVLLHEQAHLGRKDHWWKMIGFVLLAFYWFHPLVWIAYALFIKDIELACDEKAIADMDMTEKKAYARTLLSCSMHRRMVLSYPLAFGEVGVKERVKAVLNYKKPVLWGIMTAVILCVVVAVCFMTNPKSQGSLSDEPGIFEPDTESGTQTEESVSSWITVSLPAGYSLSGYYDNIGWMGGFLILPRAYEVNEEDGFAPMEWQYSGMISRIPAESTGVTYTNGIPDLSGIPMNNHSDAEYISVIGLERSTNQWPAIMLRVNHDLYTAAGIGKPEEGGADTDNIDRTSEYWYFYYVKEGEDMYYLLTLTTKDFTREEAEKIARTAVIPD